MSILFIVMVNKLRFIGIWESLNGFLSRVFLLILSDLFYDDKFAIKQNIKKTFNSTQINVIMEKDKLENAINRTKLDFRIEKKYIKIKLFNCDITKHLNAFSQHTSTCEAT